MFSGQSHDRLKDLHLQPGHTIDAEETVESLVQLIKAQKSSHRTFVVMQSTKPIGIVRSHDMFRILGTHYGVALHYKKKMS
ncbi:MAG: Diguanylate cyclase protein [Bacilli bacterium]|nr:Diguanylate cyclase protein [Bacilli bacterium]